jgi:hypothetical protein
MKLNKSNQNQITLYYLKMRNYRHGKTWLQPLELKIIFIFAILIDLNKWWRGNWLLSKGFQSIKQHSFVLSRVDAKIKRLYGESSREVSKLENVVFCKGFFLLNFRHTTFSFSQQYLKNRKSCCTKAIRKLSGISSFLQSRIGRYVLCLPFVCFMNSILAWTLGPCEYLNFFSIFCNVGDEVSLLELTVTSSRSLKGLRK